MITMSPEQTAHILRNLATMVEEGRAEPHSLDRIPVELKRPIRGTKYRPRPDEYIRVVLKMK